MVKNLKEEFEKPQDNYPWIPSPKKYIWEDHSADELARALISPEVTVIREEVNQFLDAGLVSQASNKMTELYTKAADCVL